MQTNYENDIKFNNEFLKLREFIQNGEYQKVDEWFEKNKISENQELENFLTMRIYNESVFFSFKSNSYNSFF